jgi:DNA invertase Pin-like site-specific DNA recombinase
LSSSAVYRKTSGERSIPTLSGFQRKQAIFQRFINSLPTYRFFKIAVDPPLAARIQVGMKKKYIGYFRVSTRQQGLDGNGMTSQREIVRRFVDGQQGVLDQEFSEVETGKKTSERRPQLASALDRCKRTKATLVIAKLDRLARNAEFLLRLQNSGVDFVCCDCPNADKFTVGILALVAQRERELISERTRLGLAAAKTKGIKLGTPNPEKAVAAMVTANKIAKTQFTAKLVPVIDGIKSAGVKTLQGIADCLNRRGISTRTGKTWHPATVRNILQGGGQ